MRRGGGTRDRRHGVEQRFARRAARLGVEREQPRRRGGLDALPHELLPHRVRALLVELVDADDGGVDARVADARAADQEMQERSRVDADAEPAKAELRERGGGREDHLRLDRHRRRAQHVDVALHELAEAAVLRALGAPHRAELIALEDGRQLAAMGRIVARERDGQVEAERQIGEVGPARGDGALELGAALQHLEHELLVLAAALPEKHAHALHRRRVHALEAEGLVRLADASQELVAPAILRRQEVAESARSGELGHDGPVVALQPERSTRRRRSAFAMTDTDDRLMAALATIGLRSTPITG